MGQLVLMSIKPKYGLQILKGVKKVELRGFVGNISSGDVVVLYLSNPIQAVSGEFKVGRVALGLKGVKELVESFANPGIDDEDWSYVVNRRRPMAIEVLDPVEYEVRVTLRELKDMVPGFRPPMSYRIIKPWEPLFEVLSRVRRSLTSP